MITRKNTKPIILIFLLIIIGGIVINRNIVNAKTETNNAVNIYFFHSNNCSHCKSEIKLLNSLEEKYSNIKIYRYEINEPENYEKLIAIQDIYEIKTSGVPLTIIGDTTYSGYKEEKSSIEFVKTIEYYSRYGYEDKAGQLLGVKNNQQKELNDTAPSLEKFKKTYGNYKLIGDIYTDDINISIIPVILGFLFQLNIIKIISAIILITLLSKITESKKKILLLTSYMGITFMLTIINICVTTIYKIVMILLIAIIIIKLIKQYKKLQYKYETTIFILAITTSCLENYFFSRYSLILKKIIELHNIVSINKLIYYINYFFVIVIANISIILIFNFLKKQIKKCKCINK